MVINPLLLTGCQDNLFPSHRLCSEEGEGEEDPPHLEHGSA